MEHGTPDNSSSGGDGKWVGVRMGRAYWMRPMQLGILWGKQVHNCHLRISSPQGGSRMALLCPTHCHCDLCLPSTGLACPEHCLHLKLGSGFKEPEIPLHLLWTQLKQPPQKMEFVPTPLWHTAQGSLPDFWSTSSPIPDIRTLVLPMLIRSLFPSMLVFQRISFSCSSSCDWEMMTRSSAYRLFQGHPVRNS